MVTCEFCYGVALVTYKVAFGSFAMNLPGILLKLSTKKCSFSGYYRHIGCCTHACCVLLLVTCLSHLLLLAGDVETNLRPNQRGRPHKDLLRHDTLDMSADSPSPVRSSQSAAHLHLIHATIENIMFELRNTNTSIIMAINTKLDNLTAAIELPLTSDNNKITVLQSDVVSLASCMSALSNRA